MANVIVKILQKENNYVNKEILNNSILQKSRNCDNKLEFKQSIEKYLKNRNYLIYTDVARDVQEIIAGGPKAEHENGPAI